MRHFLLLSTIFFILSASQQLKKTDVRQTFEEMLGFHVEHSELSPLLMQRANKFYIEQFDASKMYLLNGEAKGAVQSSKKKLEKGVKSYQADDLAHITQVNETVSTAILRTRQWRQEIEKELILSAHDLEASQGEVYLSYAETEEQLKARLYKQLVRILLEEKKLNRLVDWTPKDREKVCTLWERRFQRKEEPYLINEAQNEHHLALHTLRALSRSLDAHTTYFSPEEAQEMRMALEKQFEGIGVVLQEGIEGVMVIDLVKDGPAEKSGKVEIGDQIVQINTDPVAAMTYEEVLQAMKSDGKKDLTLSLRRKGDEKLHEVNLKREKILMNDERLACSSIPCGNGHIGILTLPSFYEGGHQSSADKDMREAIKKLKKEAPLKGMILDMRENAGGFLSQAVKVAGLFVSKGVIVISKYSRGEIKYLRNLDGRLSYDGPLIILTSRASASAAEIVAQALQDYGVALVVGDEETYGKGTIQYQTVTDKEAKAFYKVTVGRYYTVSGRSTQITGVKADIVVPSIFANYKIGERFLDNPLPSDQVAAAYIDPLTDIDYRSRAWFQKNYLPNLHQPQERWRKALPLLKENSQYRLEHDKNYISFLNAQAKKSGRSPRAYKKSQDQLWGDVDLQITEALNIMKDMVVLEKNRIAS